MQLIPEPNTVRNLHISKCDTARASLWMPDLPSGAQSLLLRYPGCLHRENSSRWMEFCPFFHLPIKTQTRTHLANQSSHCTFQVWTSMKKILNKMLICIPLSSALAQEQGLQHSHTWVALYMPHPSPETPVSLSISQSMALKWATQIERRWKKQQIFLCSFKESMALYLILRARQRREHSCYLCNSLIHAPRKRLRFSAMLSLGRLKYLSPSLWKSI